MRWMRALPLWMKVTGVAMLLGGVATTAVGVHLDGSDWWANRPFTTNVASALAGALLGIPISVVAVAAALDQAREYRAREQVRGALMGALTTIERVSAEMLGTPVFGPDWERRSTSQIGDVQLVEDFIDRRDSFDGPQGVKNAAARLASDALGQEDYNSRVGEVQRTWRDVLRAQQIAGLNALDFPPAAALERVDACIAHLNDDETTVPAAWSYNCEVDMVRRAAMLFKAVGHLKQEAEHLWG